MTDQVDDVTLAANARNAAHLEVVRRLGLTSYLCMTCATRRWGGRLGVLQSALAGRSPPGGDRPGAQAGTRRRRGAAGRTRAGLYYATPARPTTEAPGGPRAPGRSRPRSKAMLPVTMPAVRRLLGPGRIPAAGDGNDRRDLGGARRSTTRCHPDPAGLTAPRRPTPSTPRNASPDVRICRRDRTEPVRAGSSSTACGTTRRTPAGRADHPGIIKMPTRVPPSRKVLAVTTFSR